MSEHVELLKGDNDKKKKWGGKTLSEPPEYTVEQLQTDLKSVEVFTYTEDGDFGNKTVKALKFFQWACANVDACIKSGSRITRTKKVAIRATGKLDKATYDELKLWTNNCQVVTGDLIRVAFSSLTNIEAGSGFKKISSSSIMKDEVVISKAALPLLKELNKLAKEKKVNIKINQALRIVGVAVSGAVVTPASKSQHLIGHAFDLNIVDGTNWNTSANFKKKTESDNAKKIIKSLKSDSYRWGGDWGTPDTPHFDSKLDSNSITYDAKFFLNQRSISKMHHIPKETV